MLIGGKSTLMERIEMLEAEGNKVWIHEEAQEFIETFNFGPNTGAQYRFYDGWTKELIDAYSASYHYDYRKNRIYFRNWGDAFEIAPRTWEDGAMPDYIDVVSISEDCLVIDDGGGITEFYSK